MLQSTVMPKKSLSPTTDAMTITPFTNRYGASFRRNLTTPGASHRDWSRRHSSGLGALAAYWSSVLAEGYELDERRVSVIASLSGDTGVGARSICGIRPVSRAATTALADGNRFAGSFSSRIMITRD